MRLGALNLLPHQVCVEPFDEADSLLRHLSDVLGRSLVVSIHLGPPRANRKPVLQLLTPEGDTVAYAKVGINDVTRSLVRDETRALEELTRTQLRCLCVPQVVHSGSWRDLEVLILDPLPTSLVTHGSYTSMLRAARELSRAFGISASTVRASAYWSGLISKLEFGRGLRYVDQLRTRALALDALAGGARINFGAWHGDWTPWNTAPSSGRLLAWDWERFELGVPLGYDVLHYAVVSAQRKATGSPLNEVRAALMSAVATLEGSDIAVGHGRVVASLYLLEIASRYALDGQLEAGAPLGAVDTWVLPLLDEWINEPLRAPSL